MNIVKKALTDSIIQTYANQEKVLQYFPQSNEAIAERLLNMLNQLVNVL